MIVAVDVLQVYKQTILVEAPSLQGGIEQLELAGTGQLTPRQAGLPTYCEYSCDLESDVWESREASQEEIDQFEEHFAQQ